MCSSDLTIQEASWDTNTYCYLASVHVGPEHSPVISVLDRTQQRQQVLALVDDAWVTRTENEQDPWITVIPGSPTLDRAGSLIEVLDRQGHFRACRDGEPFSPEGWNVEAILDVGVDHIAVVAAVAPETRVLARLGFSGDVDVIVREDGESVYRSCSDTHHHHLVCRACGKTVEVDGPAVERWADKVSAEHGFTDVSHTFEIFGLCSDCSR